MIMQIHLLLAQPTKVTLSGSAKDSDGNTLGSDVVKYITP